MEHTINSAVELITYMAFLLSKTPNLYYIYHTEQFRMAIAELKQQTTGDYYNARVQHTLTLQNPTVICWYQQVQWKRALTYTV